MTEKIKRRLLGGLVILPAAALLLLLLWAERDTTLQFHAVPPPEFTKLEIERTTPPPEDFTQVNQQLDELKDNLQDQASSAPPTELAVPEQPALQSDPFDEIEFNENSIPVRWVVQVGDSYPRQQAAAMKESLAAAGFLTVIRAQADNLYAVYVGPFLLRSIAEENHNNLAAQQQLEVDIVEWR